MEYILKINKFALFSVLLFISFSVSANSILDGKKTISLKAKDDAPIQIGFISFKEENKKVTYKIEFNEELFSDEFLSMRPFKCIHKTGQMLCHLVYPYKKQGYINENDLVDLEYDLLFLHKDSTEYGINPWNGLYYDLEITQDRIVGTLKEVDLNVLAAPPEDGALRPVTRDMLYDAEPEHHLFPKLIIK